MTKSMTFLFIIVILFINITYIFAGNKFLKERYRGWIWFEKQKLEKLKKPRIYLQDALEAKRQNEKFKRELELYKHLVVHHPDNLDYIMRYKEKKKVMLEKAQLLARNFGLVNLLRPDILDESQNPINIYGRKIKVKFQEKYKDNILKRLSKNIELFVVVNSNCENSQILQKHLYNFNKKYNFNIEAISLDGVQSQYFKTILNFEFMEQLNLTTVPALLAVTNNSKLRFEIARGVVSIKNLEDRFLDLFDYLKVYKKQNLQ